MSCLHFVIGIVLLGCSAGAQSWSQTYSCEDDKEPRLLEFDLGGQLTGRFFLYYELEGFQQNHFRFAGSWSAEQMRGRHLQQPSECRPLTSAADRAALLNFTADDSSATLFPCGLMPNFYFNDTYDPVDLNWTEKGISWPKEIGNLFRTPEPALTIKEVKTLNFLADGTTDEHFVVWMRTSKSATFRKLYARLDSEFIGPGVTIQATCNFPFKWFAGQRRVVIMKMGGFGGKNIFLGVLNLMLFALCGVFALVFRIDCCSCVKEDERPHGLPGHEPVSKVKTPSKAKAGKQKRDESEDVKVAGRVEPV